jgi:hypothetical protein
VTRAGERVKGWGGLPNDTVGTLTQLFGNSVVFIDDKVLVEDLEDLATLKLSHGGGGVGHEGRRWRGRRVGIERGRGEEEEGVRESWTVEMKYRGKKKKKGSDV